MLFGYPIEATAENWLHECLRAVLQLIHANIETEKPLPVWAEMIPDPYRNRLKSRTGLRDKLKAYQTALTKLSATEQNRVLQAFNEQNKIALLLSGQCDCDTITDLPSAIRAPVKALFKYAFDLLTDPDLEIRDQHYHVIYKSMPSRVCPFCGYHPFSATGSRREALDHYLAESKYPFAGSNLRNLVPMCNKCNSGYKLAQNMLYRTDGTRRKSFDPYNCSGIQLSLENSKPFAGTLTPTGQLPQWKIEFSPNTEEVTTWDEVFHIRERYERDVLNEEFKSWLDNFKSWCHSAKVAPSSDEEWVDAINRYATLHEDMGIGDRAFLKAAVFRMLQVHCQNGDQRLIKLIRDVVIGVSM